MNRVILMGTFGKDPEVKQSAWWLAICNATIATSESYKKGEEIETITTWHNLVAFWHTANFMAKRFKKWDKILLEWKISNSSWEKPDGTKWYKSEIIVEKTEFAWWKKEWWQVEESWIESDEDFEKRVKKETIPRKKVEEEISIEDLPL